MAPWRSAPKRRHHERGRRNGNPLVDGLRRTVRRRRSLPGRAVARRPARSTASRRLQARLSPRGYGARRRSLRRNRRPIPDPSPSTGRHSPVLRPDTSSIVNSTSPSRSHHSASRRRGIRRPVDRRGTDSLREAVPSLSGGKTKAAELNVRSRVFHSNATSGGGTIATPRGTRASTFPRYKSKKTVASA